MDIQTHQALATLRNMRAKSRYLATRQGVIGITGVAQLVQWRNHCLPESGVRVWNVVNTSLYTQHFVFTEVAEYAMQGAEAQRLGASVVSGRRILYLVFPLRVLCLTLKTTLSRWAARQKMWDDGSHLRSDNEDCPEASS
ncbi:hypothetical protein TRIATDRAFT_85098 [Trichoderma atroviride IMI 206040]|uniref:Uncharacterized protein n=1 Tax=Hypocrea atroviridis (strain ATCC 20476 / IMI 206040) TaxID=452589 RepID=G9P941_HYPAI|nr:uncharacterized protein TRIATDRAFT_85098 [Trichoderma atroviride IMI 206040]EHK41069.1 hypothetical protein TRIATDRAFT_85098 [Trichoderma atroviride IMI 206040]